MNAFAPTAPPPPDRESLVPLSGIGFDTVAVRGPVSELFLEALPHLNLRQFDGKGEAPSCLTVGGSDTVQVGASNVMIRADKRFGRGPAARIEFNAPSILRGHNRDVLP